MSASPPPPYSVDPPEAFQIRRKPVRTSPAALPSPAHPERSARACLNNGDSSTETSSQPREILNPGTVLDSPLSVRPVQSVSTDLQPSSPGVSSHAPRSAVSCPPPGAESSTALSFAQKAYQEARHFAGGLINHPTESTKHFTILRHSHGIVFYQGSSTSLAISIFSDGPLPPDRTIWLQNKGWTGKTGMRAKAFLGFTGDWLDVTPTAAVRPEQLNPTDERAWQRDIAKFRKKGPNDVRERHQLRETAVVRIPVEAGDGYFQLVLCQGDKKKTLCNSPVFRVLSTSLDPSSIRGASLSTLPLELGVMALSSTAQTAFSTVVQPVTAAVQNTVHSAAQRALPSTVDQIAASALVDLTGVQDKITSVVEGEDDENDDDNRDDTSLTAGGGLPDVSRGPQSPFPIYFVARCEGPAVNQIQFPSGAAMALSGLSDLLARRLYGHYFGWVRILDKFEKEKAAGGSAWYQALISASQVDVSQLDRVNVARVIKKRFTLRLINDNGETQFSDKKLEVQVMGFIRPDESVRLPATEKGTNIIDQESLDAALLRQASDISIAEHALNHPTWSPEILFRGSSQDERLGWLDRAKNGFVSTKTTVVRHIDRLPLRKLGVRVGTDELKDKTVAANGFYVSR
ncbi:hypothetical protein NFIA_113840 [Paecilomyces variotii No. 5]|uniref:LipA and NB-ARC domain protein n=1 Tax=Byssochlamys spectabilis (strain No. 5 / NBRC 109023) TaxID=1356009 RepID=V5I4M4_BYSSN|nr:hypothetical protein NFIA_113840 [Paecilomyces variotii No. 5]